MTETAYDTMKRMLKEFDEQPKKIMKDSTIKISKEFPGLWLGQEISVAAGEDKIEAWRKAEQELDYYYRSRNQISQTDFNTGEQKIQQPTPEKNLKVEKTLIAIENSTTIPELEKHFPDALKYGLQKEYEEKKQQLSVK